MHYIGNTPTAPAATITIGTANITDGSVTLVKLDRTGVAGQVLTSNGPGVAPSWQAASAVPPGAVMPFAGASAPGGWLLCDGSAVSRTTYAALFAVVGTTYGAGNGSTTFALPDMRGRVAAGKDNMGGTSANRLVTAVSGGTLGAVGGTDMHTLTEAQMPLHGHPFMAAYTSQNSASAQTTGGFLTSTAGGARTAYSGAVSAAQGQQIGGTGGGAAHMNTQPTLVLNYIIKT